MRVAIPRIRVLLPLLSLGAIGACSPAEREAVEREAEEAASEVRATAEEAADRVAALTGEARREAEREIMELEREWSRRAGEGDVAWIVERHAEQGRMMPPNGEAAVGREALREAWSEMTGTEGLEVSWEPTEAHVSRSGDMAYDIGTYTLTMPDGTTDRGKYLVVWVKEDGEWKIAADIFNSNQPPAGG